MRPAAFLPTRPPPEQRASPWTFRLAVLGVVLGTLAISLEAISLASRLAPHSASSGGGAPAGPGLEDSPPTPLEAPLDSLSSASASIAGDPAPVLGSPLFASSLLGDAETLRTRSATDDNAAAAPASLDPVAAAEPWRVAASGAWLGGGEAPPGAEDANEASSSPGAVSGSLDAIYGSSGAHFDSPDASSDSAGAVPGQSARRAGRRGDGVGLDSGGRGGGGGGESGWEEGSTEDGDGGAGVAAGGGEGGGSGGSSARPNLVLLIADDAGLGDISALRASSGGAAARAPAHLAVGGPPHGLTPNLDSIARKGVSFFSAHAAAPLCAPSRFSILTGQPASCAASSSALRALTEKATQLMANMGGAETEATLSPPSVTFDSRLRQKRHRTLAHRLSALGYRTGVAGLWHVGGPSLTGAKRDLERVKGVTRDAAEKAAAGGSSWATLLGGKVKRTVAAEYAALQEHVKKVGSFDWAERLYAAPLDGEGVILPPPMKVHNIEWIADGAAQFIQQAGGPGQPPFFLLVGWTLPHGPDARLSLEHDASSSFTPSGIFRPNEALAANTLRTRQEVRKAAFDFAATFPSPDDVPNPAWPAGWQGHKRYAQAVAWLDRGVGTVLWALSHRGILHSTLLAFTSDQPSVDKGHCYTQGTRTPMMMQWPGRIPAGGGYYGLVSLADLVPTFLEAAGGEGNLSTPRPWSSSSPAPGTLGVSLLPAATASSPSAAVPPPDIHSWLLCESGRSRAILTATHRYLVGKGEADFGASKRHPAVQMKEQLYDTVADPLEVTELISTLLSRPDGSGSNATSTAAAAAAAQALVGMRATLMRVLANASAPCGVV